MRVTADRELLAPRADVWALVAEPYHLPDWWPAYTGVEPDRRGLATGARWRVRRSRAPGFLRRPGGEGTIELRRVEPGRALEWLDVAQRLEAGVELLPAPEGRTKATVSVEASWWRLLPEGGHGLPREAVRRLFDLCQTAAEL